MPDDIAPGGGPGDSTTTSSARPTFGEALEQASASADSGGTATSTSPAGSSPAPSLRTSSDPAPPATAATQPGAGDGTIPQPVATEEWDSSLGPIPVDRHKAILENTRTKAREEARAQFQQDYGELASLHPQQAHAVTALVKSWASDPVQFVLGALDELNSSPQYAPALRSHVARMLATKQNGQAQPAPVSNEPPGPDIVVDGTEWYSAQRTAERERWFQNKLLSEVRQEFAPLQEDIAARQERDTIVAATQAANKFATQTITEMNRLPYFKEQKAEIEKVFRGMPPMPDQMVGQAIRDAYITVLTTKVLPSLSNTAKSDLLSSLNQKAAASVRNPSNGSVAVAARPKSFEEALRQADAAQRR